MDKSSKKVLLEQIKKLRSTPILVVGDLMLDHYVWGQASRVSQEAPVIVVEVNKEDIRLGGAGGVVNNLVHLGAVVSVCGVVGDDESGVTLRDLLARAEVSAAGVVTIPGRQTTLKTRVIAHSQQVIRVDREDTAQIDSKNANLLNDCVEKELANVKGVIVSDYAKGTVTPVLFELFGKLKAAGKIGWKKLPVIVDPKPPHYGFYKNVTVIKPNRGEAEAGAGISIKSRSDAIRASQKLLTQWDCEMILNTLGDLGSVLVSRIPEMDQSVELETSPKQVYDVSGAGDTVCAVFMLALASGAQPRIAAELANYAAEVVVGEIGTVPITTEKLIAAVEEGER